jgi:ABC-type transport system involved in multi-copper enzyme maturation permease subunit
MLWNIFNHENTKILKRSLLWIELGLLAMLVMISFITLDVTMKSSTGGTTISSEAREAVARSITWPGALQNGYSIAGGNGLGGLLLIVFVGAVTAGEYRWRTLHLWLSRGIPRKTFLLGKFAALIIPALLIVLVSVLTSGIISAIFTIQLNGALDLNEVDLSRLLLSMLCTAYSLLPYGGLAFLLAVLSRSAVVSIGGGLAFALLIESLLAQMMGMLGGRMADLARYFPGALANDVTNLSQNLSALTVPSGANLLTFWQAVGGIALWVVFLLGLSTWVFQRQDLCE